MASKFVSQEYQGSRLDKFLRTEIPTLKQGMIEKLLRKGAIRLNGEKVKSSHRLEAGHEVTYPDNLEGLEAIEKPKRTVSVPAHLVQDLKKCILFEDNDLMVLNKPAGLSVQGGTGQTKHIDAILKALMGKSESTPKLVHRLDKDTSGILVVAKNLKTAQFLTRAFAQKGIQKKYWAIVVGVPDKKEGRISLPLEKATFGDLEKMVVDEDGKHAVTYYKVKESLGRAYTWLELEPHTGRTPQLRVHCADEYGLNCPILGDGKYGGDRAHPQGRVSLHLHAREITLPHPKGKSMTFKADLPQHMKITWEKLGLSEE